MTAEIVGLVVLALVLFVAEAHVPSGILGLLGIAALVGAGLIYRDQGHGLPVVVIVAVAVVLGALVDPRRPQSAAGPPQRAGPMTGTEELTGSIAQARSTLDPDGQVFVEGAIWGARLAAGASRVSTGDKVRVQSVDGLTLVVEPVAETEESGGLDGSV